MANLLINEVNTNQGPAKINYNGLANLPDLKNMFSNPNLLINSDFRNPVNQRGQTNYTGTGSSMRYTIDRWGIINGPVLTVQDGSLKIQVASSDAYSGKFKQPFEHALPSDFYTLSVKVKSNTHNVSITNFGKIDAGFTGIYSYATQLKLTLDDIEFFIAPGASIEIEWIKLERGAVATPLVPRSYAEEMAMCQRYYRILHRTPMFTADTTRVSYFVPAVFGVPLRDAPVLKNIQVVELLNSSAVNQTDSSVTAISAYKQNIASVTLSKNIGTFGYISLNLDAEIY